jgi:hypothetical protein
VAVNGRYEAAIDAVVGEIRGDGGDQAIGAECTDFAAIERMRRRAVEIAEGEDRAGSVRARFRVLVLWKYDERCAVFRKGLSPSSGKIRDSADVPSRRSRGADPSRRNL